MRAAGDESESDSDEFMIFDGLPSYDQSEESYKSLPKMESKEFLHDDQMTKTTKTVEMCQQLEYFRIAAMNGNLEMVERLVADGINVNESLKGGWSALLYSCSGGFHHLVLYLLEHGANPNGGKDTFSPLMGACASSKSDDNTLICVRHLLNNGANVNAIEERHRMTALMLAAKTGKVEVVKLLIEKGADVNAKDNRGIEPLSWATNSGHGSVIKILLESGADLSHEGDNGETALSVAASRGYNKIEEVLHKLQDSKEDSTIDNLSLLNDLPKKEKSKLSLETYPKIQKYGDLEMFLVGLQLSDLITLFQENQISFQMLLSLSEEELIKLGVKQLGVRKQILDAIREIHKKEWSTCSMPVVRDKRHITCPEACAIVENVTQHLNFIQSTMVYLHKQSRLNPEDLEMGKNDVNVTGLLHATVMACDSLRKLEIELSIFRGFLSKASRQVENHPVGVIGSPSKIASNKYFSLVPYCLLTASLFGFFYLKSSVTKFFHFPFAFIRISPLAS